MLQHQIPIKVRVVMLFCFICGCGVVLQLLLIGSRQLFRNAMKRPVAKAKQKAAAHSYQLAVIIVLGGYLMISTFVVHRLESIIKWTAAVVSHWAGS